MTKHYEHYAGITSQIHFCASPIRLDTQSECQMACTYCFAKARGGFRGNSNLQMLSVSALRRRLQRAFDGSPRGAFEEFLERRVPLQLGGMTDPFSKSSVFSGAIFETLETINEFDYPTIISTKGRMRDLKSALNLFVAGNYYVRISCAASQFEKSLVEPGTPGVAETLEVVSMLSENGVAVCLRIQPIFPDAEEQASALAVRAASFGAKAVSLEYLKVPKDRTTTQYRQLDALYKGRMESVFAEAGMSTDGREFSLNLERRRSGLRRLKLQLNRQQVRVGIAENELLHYSDLEGCCNGGSEFLRRAENFTYNVPSLIKRRSGGEITLGMFSEQWKPKLPVGRHFNSHSRFGLRGLEATWDNFFRIRWNDLKSRFNPTFFDGVEHVGEIDEAGNLVYRYTPDESWSAFGQTS